MADRARILGTEHPDALASRGNLANAYRAAKRNEDAIVILEPLLEDLERTYGAEHPDTERMRENLANARRDVARIKGADTDTDGNLFGDWD